jgi:hypothetical protein
VSGRFRCRSRSGTGPSTLAATVAARTKTTAPHRRPKPNCSPNLTRFIGIALFDGDAPRPARSTTDPARPGGFARCATRQTKAHRPPPPAQSTDLLDDRESGAGSRDRPIWRSLAEPRLLHGTAMFAGEGPIHDLQREAHCQRRSPAPSGGTTRRPWISGPGASRWTAVLRERFRSYLVSKTRRYGTADFPTASLKFPNFCEFSQIT